MTVWQWCLLAAGIAVVAYVAFVVWLLLTGRRHDVRALVGFIPDCIVLVRRLLRDDRVSRRGKLLLGALIAYLAMPFDFIEQATSATETGA